MALLAFSAMQAKPWIDSGAYVCIAVRFGLFLGSLPSTIFIYNVNYQYITNKFNLVPFKVI